MKVDVMNALGIEVTWMSPIPLDEWSDHEPATQERISELETSMEKRGWFGPAIVAHKNDYAITGTHRIHAWNAVYGDKLPVVQIEKIFDIYGVREHTGIDYDDMELNDIAEAVHLYIPEKIADAYGIDLH